MIITRGYGIGGGGGGGGNYPAGYIASAIDVEIDLNQGIVVALSNNNLGVSVDYNKGISVSVDSSSVDVEVTASDETLEVST